ncbi:MAG: endonuclease domain-containing protein [Reyranellaceae bacterium]
MRPAPHDQSSLTCRVRHVDVTDAESTMWDLLEPCQDGVRHFRRHVAIGPYVVDFACVEARLVVEIDRGLHGAGRDYESVRTRFLERQGFAVLRFWSNDVVVRGEAVRDTIRARLLLQ